MKLNRFKLVHILPYFIGTDEQTGKKIIFNNWRTDVCEILAKDINEAKQVAALTGIKEGETYHDILTFIGYA